MYYQGNNQNQHHALFLQEIGHLLQLKRKHTQRMKLINITSDNKCSAQQKSNHSKGYFWAVLGFEPGPLDPLRQDLMGWFKSQNKRKYFSKGYSRYLLHIWLKLRVLWFYFNTKTRLP